MSVGGLLSKGSAMNKRQQRKRAKRRVVAFRAAWAGLFPVAKRDAFYITIGSWSTPQILTTSYGPPYKEWRNNCDHVTHLVTIPGYIRLCDCKSVNPNYTVDLDMVTCLTCIARDER